LRSNYITPRPVAGGAVPRLVRAPLTDDDHAVLPELLAAVDALEARFDDVLARRHAAERASEDARSVGAVDRHRAAREKLRRFDAQGHRPVLVVRLHDGGHAERAGIVADVGGHEQTDIVRVPACQRDRVPED
jgi:hypothetical protein